MVNARYWLAFAFAFGLCACGEETASVGDLRCVGDSITCESVTQGNSEVGYWEIGDPAIVPIDAGAPDVLPEGEVEVVWTAELPCASETCSWAPQVVVEEDGSLTVAADFREGDSPDGPSVGGVWLGRYGADGVLLAENDDLVEHGLKNVGIDLPQPPSVGALAATPRGTLLVADAVYTVADDATLKQLWDPSGETLQAQSIASIGDDLLVAGTFWSPGKRWSTAYSEVARYDRKGALEWRQTALQAPDPSHPPVTSNIPMVVGKDGRIFVVALDHSLSSRARYWRRLFALAPDGNVSWAGLSITDVHEEDNAYLELTSEGDVVVAHGVYTLDLYHPVGKRYELRSLTRSREEYWEFAVRGFDVDDEDRVLVLTQEGDRDARRFIIDRYSPDLAERQTFAFSDDALGEPSDEFFAPSHPMGLRIGPAGETYVWTSERIVRIELQ